MANASVHGLLIVDKPGGITSRAAVDRAQCWFPRGARVGHTGTLDPLATGVLVLCVGAATRLTEYVQRMRKTYAAGIVLGARSDTDDADGQVTPCAGVSAPSHERVVDALQAFVGDIEQVPPAYSAALVAGRRAYDMARGGEAVSLAARRVTIDAIEVTRYEYPRLDVVVRCGKGTYIRSLARDLGNRLGCGGYIAALRRTRVGAFDEAAALPLDADRATARAALLPVTLAVAELRRVTVSPAEVQRVRQGQTIRLPATAPRAAGEVALFDERGALVAVAEVDMAHDAVRPGKVFAGQE